MCSNKDLFSTYDTVFKGALLMKKNASYKIVRIWTGRTITCYQVFRAPADARHMPNLKRILGSTW